MEPYDLDAEKVIAWAVSYADYASLEKVAKAVYSVYVQRRKDDYPEEDRENKRRRQYPRRRDW